MTTETDNRPLHQRYRPQTFDQVIGQDHIIKSLKAQVAAPDRPHAYMFIGPAGSAKTSLALILAKELGCTDFGIEVINAPVGGGIDAIRDLVARSDAMALGSDVKVIVIDEIHSLSKVAWSALLDPTEFTPEHTYWIFCSTEEPKVPIPSKTRLIVYRLNPVQDDLLKPYTAAIAKKAGISIPDGALDVIMQHSRGSVRQALIHLQAIRGLDTLHEVEKQVYNKISDSAGDDSATERLGKLLISKCTDWSRYRNLLWNVTKEDPSSVRPTLIRLYSYELQKSDDPWRLMLLLKFATELPEVPEPYAHMANLQLMIGGIIKLTNK